jgi:hypothetical protein
MRSRSRFVLALQMLPALVAMLLVCAVPGRAQVVAQTSSVQWGDHAVVATTNNTRYESWVDISWSYWGQGWHIEKAFCLKPHESYTYRVSYNHPSLQPQVRVRGEIKLDGCANGTHTVVSGDGRVAKSRENFTVTGSD